MNIENNIVIEKEYKMKKYTLNDIIAIVVLYNCLCENSISYNRLKEKGIRIIVCDNSTSDLGNKNIVKSDNNIYIDMEGNKGLSKAFNAALEQIGDNYKFICLFDDDTDIDGYFGKVLEYINSFDSDIFLPIVKTQTKVLSPCQFKNKKIIEVKNSDDIDKKYISAINSGMVIKKDIFNHYRYNENIFLDYVDHNFMRDMTRLHKDITIMKDNIINQNFSIETNSLESSYNRLCILNHDLREFYKNDYIIYFFQITAYKLVMIKKFKSLKFIYLKKYS